MMTTTVAAPPTQDRKITNRIENFKLERQKHSLWCWAAVSTSVDHYFSPRSTSTQCRIAKKVLGLAACCETPTPVVCNHTARLQDALAAVGRLKGRRLKRAFTFKEIKREIDRGRPVCVLIRWTGGGGHFVVICNYDEAQKVVEIADPRYEPGTTISMRFRDFVYGYNLGLGRWKATFRVEP